MPLHALSFAAAAFPVPKFELMQALDHPVISSDIGKDLYHINNGFEGGLFTKESDGYHLFPTECMSDMPGVPWDIHTESHHWTSPDGINNWTMRDLAYNSSAKLDGSDRRGAIFALMNIFHEDEDRWNLFYIGYTLATQDRVMGLCTAWSPRRWAERASVGRT